MRCQHFFNDETAMFPAGISLESSQFPQYRIKLETDAAGGADAEARSNISNRRARGKTQLPPVHLEFK
jgi:hypothetical protein